jgi:arylsulfatase
MEVYAAMVDCMDQGIGRIVAELKKQGCLDTTLLLFLQDNGGCAEGLGRRGKQARAVRPTLPPMRAEELQTAMIPKQTRDGYPVLQGRAVMPGPADTYIAYGRNWANVSNTPFREYKHWVHEGGIATPLIAHWPQRIKRKGELEHQPGHLIDLMATCVDVAGATYPKRYLDNDIQPMEGRSLLPAFAGETIDREAIFWEHEGNRAIRIGSWKLVAKGPAGPWELYDMVADRTEMHDLAATKPERVKTMVATWEAWARRLKVLPWIWKPPYGQKPAAAR